MNGPAPDKKDTFIADVMTMTNQLSKYYTDRSREIHKSYFDNGHNTGITQEDLDRLYPGVTLADFTAGITMMGELNNFTGGQPVAAADYQATINKQRITGLV